jgi:hypothetical protein
VGFEPTRPFGHGDLNTASLPSSSTAAWPAKSSVNARKSSASLRANICSILDIGPDGTATRRGHRSTRGPWLHCRSVTHTPLSSRGLGRRILSPETRVRIPVAVPLGSLAFAGLFYFGGGGFLGNLSRICREKVHFREHGHGSSKEGRLHARSDHALLLGGRGGQREGLPSESRHTAHRSPG